MSVEVVFGSYILGKERNSGFVFVSKQLIITMITVLFIVIIASVRANGEDWLVTRVGEPVKIEKQQHGREIVLNNGLISRTLRLQPNAATVAG
jgi:hypothetical protein